MTLPLLEHAVDFLGDWGVDAGLGGQFHHDRGGFDAFGHLGHAG